jgi:Zn-dependent protease with chaperone function
VGASLTPHGVNGLLLLAAGRYVYERVNLGGYLEQTRSRETNGRWTGLAELFTTHPFIVNRVRTLYQLGLWREGAASADGGHGPQPA